MSDPHTTRPLELDLRKCRHGETGSHWYDDPDPWREGRLDGKMWCAGPDLGMSEPWRAQLEWQMTAGERFTFHGDEVPAPPEGHVIPGDRTGRWSKSVLRHERLTTEELHTVQVLHDSMKDFKPLGWSGFGRFVWYDEPIYNALVKEFGFDPLEVAS